MLNYEYPGNVRELENIIMSSMSMSDDNVTILDSSCFSFQHSMHRTEQNFEGIGDEGIDEYLGRLEKNIIEDTLENNGNNITKAAEELKIKRQTLQHKLKKYNIKI